MAATGSQPGPSSGFYEPLGSSAQFEDALFDLLVNELADGPRLRQLLKRNNLAVVVKGESNKNDVGNNAAEKIAILEKEAELEKSRKENEELKVELGKSRMENEDLKAERETNELIWSGIMQENTALKEEMRSIKEQLAEHTQVKEQLKTENERILKEKEKATWKSREVQFNLRNELSSLREQLKEKENNFEARVKEKLVKIQEMYDKDRTRRSTEIIALKDEKERLETEVRRFELFLEKLRSICGLPTENAADLLASSGRLDASMTEVENWLQERSQERSELEICRENIQYFKSLFEEGSDYLASNGITAAPQSSNATRTVEFNSSFSSSLESESTDDNLASAGSGIFRAILANIPQTAATPPSPTSADAPCTKVETENVQIPAMYENNVYERPKSPPIAVIHATTSLVAPPSPSSSFPPTPPPEDTISTIKFELEVSQDTPGSQESPSPSITVESPPATTTSSQAPDETDIIHKIEELNQYPPPTVSQEQSSSIPTLESGLQESASQVGGEAHIRTNSQIESDNLTETQSVSQVTGDSSNESYSEGEIGPQTTSSEASSEEPPRKKQRCSVCKPGCRVPKQLTPFAVTDKKHGVNKGSSTHRCLCGYGYSKEKDLKAHIRKMTMEWRHKCESCKFYFFTVADLNKHHS